MGNIPSKNIRSKTPSKKVGRTQKSKESTRTKHQSTRKNVQTVTIQNPDSSDGSAWKNIDEHVSFDYNQRLGSNVFRGKFSYPDGETVDAAVKFVQKSDRSDREAHNLKNLNHPNVIRLLWYGDCEDQVNDFYVAVELCQKSLEQLMAENEGPDYCRENCQKIISDIRDGLKYTHSKGIIHRDINPSNILLNADGNFVIADFDLSKKPHDVNEQSMCSRGFDGYWSSPELLKGQGHSAKSDRYSVGLVLYWLLTGGKHAVEHRHVDGKTEITGSPKTHLIDESCCDDHEIARDLINQLLESNPDDRIDLESIPKHPFFLSDDEKIQFLRSLYTEIEHLQKDLPKRGSEKAKKKNIKQLLHQPAAEIVGTNWSEKMKLDDDEMQKCFNGRRDPNNEKRHAIFNFVQPKEGDRDPYEFDSPFSLVRLVRNIQTHKKKHKKDIQIILKTCGHWRFFSLRFPGLFMYVWNNLMDKSFHNVTELRDKYCIGPSIPCPAIPEGQKKRSKRARNRSSATTPSVQQSSPQNAEDANNNRSSGPAAENSVDASFHGSDFEILTHQTSMASIKDDNVPDQVPVAGYDSQNTERRQSQSDSVNTQNVIQNAKLKLTQQSEETVVKELWGNNTYLGTEGARARSRESLLSTTPSGSENSRDLERQPPEGLDEPSLSGTGDQQLGNDFTRDLHDTEVLRYIDDDENEEYLRRMNDSDSASLKKQTVNMCSVNPQDDDDETARTLTSSDSESDSYIASLAAAYETFTHLTTPGDKRHPPVGGNFPKKTSITLDTATSSQVPNPQDTASDETPDFFVPERFSYSSEESEPGTTNATNSENQQENRRALSSSQLDDRERKRPLSLPVAEPTRDNDRQDGPGHRSDTQCTRVHAFEHSQEHADEETAKAARQPVPKKDKLNDRERERPPSPPVAEPTGVNDRRQDDRGHRSDTQCTRVHAFEHSQEDADEEAAKAARLSVPKKDRPKAVQPESPPSLSPTAIGRKLMAKLYEDKRLSPDGNITKQETVEQPHLPAAELEPTGFGNRPGRGKLCNISSDDEEHYQPLTPQIAKTTRDHASKRSSDSNINQQTKIEKVRVPLLISKENSVVKLPTPEFQRAVRCDSEKLSRSGARSGSGITLEIEEMHGQITALESSAAPGALVSIKKMYGNLDVRGERLGKTSTSSELVEDPYAEGFENVFQDVIQQFRDLEEFRCFALLSLRLDDNLITNINLRHDECNVVMMNILNHWRFITKGATPEMIVDLAAFHKKEYSDD